MQYWEQSEINRMLSVRFQVKPFNITVIQVYAPTTDSKEKVGWFYDDLQPSRTNKHQKKKKKKCPFHHRGLEIKIGSQEIPGVTDKFGFGVQIEAGEKLTEFFKRTHWS